MIDPVSVNACLVVAVAVEVDNGQKLNVVNEYS